MRAFQAWPHSAPVTACPAHSRTTAQRVAPTARCVPHAAASQYEQRSAQQEQPHPQLSLSKRSTLAAALLSCAAAALPAPAEASALADFLRSRQAANGGAVLLAPMRAAVQQLGGARDALMAGVDEGALKEALGAARAASFNCYIFESMDGDTIPTRASLLQQNLKVGDPCTYRLIAKNVTNLLGREQAGLEAEVWEALGGVIDSFEALELQLGALYAAPALERGGAVAALDDTVARVQRFEGLIAQAIGVA